MADEIQKMFSGIWKIIVLDSEKMNVVGWQIKMPGSEKLNSGPDGNCIVCPGALIGNKNFRIEFPFGLTQLPQTLLDDDRAQATAPIVNPPERCLIS